MDVIHQSLPVWSLPSTKSLLNSSFPFRSPPIYRLYNITCSFYKECPKSSRVLYDDYDNRHAYLGYRFKKTSFSRCWKRFWPFHLFLVFPDLVWYWTVSSTRRSSILATFLHLLCYWMVSYTCWVFSHKVQSFFSIKIFGCALPKENNNLQLRKNAFGQHVPLLVVREGAEKKRLRRKNWMNLVPD